MRDTVLVGAVLVLAFAAGCTGDPTPSRGRRPNVILISIDTLRADRLQVYGYDRPTSPAIDALAARGTRFDSAIAESPWTLPSHMTMLTGLHPGEHGAVEPVSKLGDSVPTVAERLREAGYRTFASTGGGNVRGAVGFARGFEVYGEEPVDFAETLRNGLRHIAEIDDAAPYFLFLHTYATHCPYDPAADDVALLRTWSEADRLPPRLHCGVRLRRWANQENKEPTAGQLRYLSDMYDASIRGADARLAEFIAALDARGELDRSLLILTSDHGEAFRDIRRVGHESILNIEVLRVPLILVGPGIPAGRAVAAPVGLIDVAATILAAAGLPTTGLPGRPLQPVVAGDTPGESPRFSENNFGELMRSVVDGDRHLIWHLVEDERELFDLGADPGEERPLPLDEAGRRLGIVLEDHVEELVRRRVAGRTGGAPEPQADLSEADAERLRSLGYLDEDGTPP